MTHKLKDKKGFDNPSSYVNVMIQKNQKIIKYQKMRIIK